MTDAATYTILVVCTGNICRSPAAEALLASGLGNSVKVISAGTRARQGESISPPMGTLLERDGVVLKGFTARHLTAELVSSADLVIGMSRAHRSAAVQMWPKSVRSAFTLLQLARLLELMDVAHVPAGSAAERLRFAVPLAAAQGRPPARLENDDVGDPYRRGNRAYRRAYRDIKSAVDGIIDAVGPRS